MKDKKKFNFKFWPWKSSNKYDAKHSADDLANKESIVTSESEQANLQTDADKPKEDITAIKDELDTNTHLDKEPETARSTTSFFDRIWRGLKKTRNTFIASLSNLFSQNTDITDELLEELEEKLLIADIGIKTTTEIMENLQLVIKKNKITDPKELFSELKQQLEAILQEVEQPLCIDRKDKFPFVILVTGVNGVGKTTTIGKLANRFKAEGKQVMLAAGDTFRAAAIEQLDVWAKRNTVPIISQQQGSDSASVIYDALQSAMAKNIDVLIADTAGRLQNKANLMEELKKIKRVLGKINPNIPQETILVIDAATGQNALNQVEIFNKDIGLTSMILTKLDGTAKGGIIFPLSKIAKLPIRFIGVGEKATDLRPFSAQEFIDALFAHDQSEAKQDNLNNEPS